MSRPEIKISIIIPVYNESKNIEILHNEIIQSLPNFINYEIIFRVYNDGISFSKTFSFVPTRSWSY